jgi:peptide methionine sulfoxide reductase MsrB
LKADLTRLRMTSDAEVRGRECTGHVTVLYTTGPAPPLAMRCCWWMSHSLLRKRLLFQLNLR